MSGRNEGRGREEGMDRGAKGREWGKRRGEGREGRGRGVRSRGTQVCTMDASHGRDKWPKQASSRRISANMSFLISALPFFFFLSFASSALFVFTPDSFK